MNLTEEQFAEMFRTFDLTAFRLETRAAYAMTIEREAFARFKAGRPQPPQELPWWQSWLDDMRELTRNGRQISRVRVVDDPPTDYQRWEMWATRYHLEAGEDIRYLSRSRASVLSIPPGDWWLFDSAKLVLMAFTSGGEVDGKLLITDPEMIDAYQAWRDVALRHATEEAAA